MPLYRKTGPTTWTLGTPATKAAPAAWSTPSKVYSKTGVSTWTEVWPRQPGSPSALAASMPYRNDRIEMDLSWTAANGSGTTTTPVAPATYNFTVVINGTPVYTSNIAGTSVTLTNSSNGWQAYAGQTMYFAVQAISAAGVGGPVVNSANYTVPQLPAPPAVTSVSQLLTYGDLSYGFNHVSGNRLTGFQVNVYSSYGNATYYYGKATSVLGGGHPWSGASVSGGSYNVDIYAYGPGGYSPAASFSGVIPSDPGFSSTSFSGDPGADGSRRSDLVGYVTLGANTSYMQLYWNQEGGANNYWGNVGTGGIALGTGTIGGALARYRWIGVPVNAYGTGRVIGSPFVRRISNPVIIKPDDGATWIGGYGGWYNGAYVVEQGWDTANGGSWCYGHFFYGDKIMQNLSTGYLGYDFQLNVARMACFRDLYGGAGAVAPQFYHHTARNRGEANLSFFNGPVAGSGMNVGDAVMQNISLPALITQAGGAKGIGIGVFNIGDTNQARNMVLRSPGQHYGMYGVYGALLGPGDLEIVHYG